MVLTLYVGTLWAGECVCEDIDQSISSPHHAATRSCDGQTGSLLGAACRPANHFGTKSPALLTALNNIAVWYSLSQGLPSGEFVPLTNGVEER